MHRNTRALRYLLATICATFAVPAAARFLALRPAAVLVLRFHEPIEAALDHARDRLEPGDMDRIRLPVGRSKRQRHAGYERDRDGFVRGFPLRPSV